MSSVFVVAKLRMVPQSVALVPVDSLNVAMRDALFMADVILAILGGTVGFVAFVWWLSLSPQRPLAPPPPRPNHLREDSLALALLVFLTAYLVASGLLELAGGGAASELMSGAAASAAQMGGIAICLWIAGKTFDGGVRRFCFGETGAVGEKAAWTALATLVALGVCWLILQATAALVRHVHPEHQFEPHRIIEALRDEAQPMGVTIGLWLGAVVVAPIAEEFFFRGLLQTYLVGVLRRRWIAVGVASAGFGLAHCPQLHAVPALVFLGVLFGCVYERTGSLWPPILMHAVFNLKTLIWESLDGFAA